MRPTIALGYLRVSIPKKPLTPYAFPSLSSISISDLPNNGFGKNNYNIKKTKYGHWPVYRVVQNTRVLTEIKRVEGDVEEFKNDLLAKLPHIQDKYVTVNKKAGQLKIKGDFIDSIKEVFDVNIN
ncbi:hypothetical protein HYPBUDRAFT_159649 [Hyphopichia burtonii NRRL Y-1933]|uniref:Large ribosomal subunit protein mL49 n=1 Tax=Hyphopichia burtonii NRRL Y-1933 TaxID=984485 RepID=A0A1E4RRY0_9ASCO|nr:hypothetical protein HYPBUDRAFT_159649 [Hyphopichia burtonii NRRL Y-1933]ODV69825.1 hypothetical protein HYPBUDRAFT_159649 [Hyphopichia burtonii NRRL Y-1933]